MFENQIVKLADLCTDVSYGYTASADSNKVGPKFLRITDIQGGVVDWDEVPYCEIEEGKLKKNKLESGDIVVARTGNSTGENYLFLASVDAVFASYLIRFRVNPELANPYFVWLQLRTKKWWDYVSGAKSGSAQAGANAKVLGQFEFYLPEREIQDRASNTVLNFNEKIELNTQTNQTLEQMAQAIFKSWFVDFDPVKAKIEALATGGSTDDAELAAMRVISAKTVDELNSLKASNPEAFNKLAQTAALFPAAMQNSELGEIPVGWEISEIGNEVIVVGGGTPSTKNTEFWEDGTIHWTTPKDMSGLNCKVLTNTDRKITEAGLKKISSGLLSKNTVLMSSRAPVGYLALAKIPVAINQGYIAMKCEGRLSPEYVLLWCEHNMEEIKQRASGTTFAEISKANFKPIPVIVPTKSIIDTFTVQASDIYNIVHANVLQSETLSISRDLLLPQLLSGELSDVFKDGE